MGKGGTVALMSETGRIWRRVGRRHVKGSGSTKVIICISPVRGGVGPFLTGVPAPRLLACSLGKKSLLTEKHFLCYPYCGLVLSFNSGRSCCTFPISYASFEGWSHLFVVLFFDLHLVGGLVISLVLVPIRLSITEIFSVFRLRFVLLSTAPRKSL